MVPNDFALLEGATNVVIDGVFHSMSQVGTFDGPSKVGGVLRTSNRTQIRHARMTYFQGECSYRRDNSVRRFTMSVECLF